LRLVFIIIFVLFSINYAQSADVLFLAKKDIDKIQYQAQVNQLIKQMDSQSIAHSLESLTHFPDRSANTTYGMEAAYWIKSQIEIMIKESGRQDVSIFLVTTKNVKQSSIVVKVGHSIEPGIVIGAHVDTYKKYDPETSKEMCKDMQDPKIKKLCEDTLSGNKPGADDDGSGSSVTLEVARMLINSGMQFKKPIYLIWYADEEDGMLGSQSVVEDFQKRNIPIKAVMQLDQVGFSYHNDSTIWLVDNYVDTNLTAYIADLIREYIQQPIKYTSCRGPCSDHVSWNAQGIPVVFPFESEMALGRGNPYVHSPLDTIDKLSLAHMADFAKLAIAFAVELAEPVNASHK